ncbi:MAG: ribonuclease III [Casimicrobiaceae bacterium]
MPSPPGSSLGYVFHRPELQQQALTHRSFGADHNERLEFIGDSVLNCAIAWTLYQRFPSLPEGELSRMRANLVNKDTLHRLAQGLDLGQAVRLGEGEMRSGGPSRPSILADALEAMLGAILVDGGFDAARSAVERVYANELSAVNPAGMIKDPKTRLQEWLQSRRLPVPEYVIVAVNGDAHLQTFEVVCRIPALDIAASGSGASRRAAEQIAAAQAYEQAATR